MVLSARSRQGESWDKRGKGRWTLPEHRQFLEGLKKHGKDWKLIADLVPTRTIVQIRTHAQKYFLKIEKGQTFPEEPYESDGGVTDSGYPSSDPGSPGESSEAASAQIVTPPPSPEPTPRPTRRSATSIALKRAAAAASSVTVSNRSPRSKRRTSLPARSKESSTKRKKLDRVKINEVISGNGGVRPTRTSKRQGRTSIVEKMDENQRPLLPLDLPHFLPSEEQVGMQEGEASMVPFSLTAEALGELDSTMSLEPFSPLPGFNLRVSGLLSNEVVASVHDEVDAAEVWASENTGSLSGSYTSSSSTSATDEEEVDLRNAFLEDHNLLYNLFGAGVPNDITIDDGSGAISTGPPDEAFMTDIRASPVSVVTVAEGDGSLRLEEEGSKGTVGVDQGEKILLQAPCPLMFSPLSMEEVGNVEGEEGVLLGMDNVEHATEAFVLEPGYSDSLYKLVFPKGHAGEL
ncbi:unnamed protein product [Choristocarpus tenellus]